MRGMSTSETTRSKGSVLSLVSASMPSTVAYDLVARALEDALQQRPRGDRVLGDEQRARALRCRRRQPSRRAGSARARDSTRSTTLRMGMTAPLPEMQAPAMLRTRASCGPRPLDHHLLLSLHLVDEEGDLAVGGAHHHHRPSGAIRAAGRVRRARGRPAGAQATPPPAQRDESGGSRPS